MTNMNPLVQWTKKIRYWIAFSLSFAVLLFSVYHIVSKLWDDHSSDLAFKEIRSELEIAEPSQRFEAAFEQIDQKGEPQPDSQLAEVQPIPYQLLLGNLNQINEQGILNEYEKLKKQNDDMVGWINMPGFKKPIDYPIMRAANNEFYLHKDFNKNDSNAGSIFMDAANDPTTVQNHIILYGHAMLNNSMFGNLRAYNRTQDNYLNKTKIYIDLMNTRLEYEVFSAYTTDASYNYRQTAFNNDKEYTAFLERIQKRSVYDYGVKLGPMDKILTLSTCDDAEQSDGRSVVHAKLVRQIVYDDSADQSEVTDSLSAKDDSVKKPVLANVYLKQLTLSYSLGSSVVNKKLVSTFDDLHKQFSLEVPTEVRAISLSMKTTDPKAKVQATANQHKVDPTGKIELLEGENEVRLKIISRDLQYARYYTIKILRLVPEPIKAPVI